MAQGASRLTMLVYVPNRALTPTGSAATSASVGCPGLTGNRSASALRKVRIAAVRSSASRCWPRETAEEGPPRPPPRLGQPLLAAVDVGPTDRLRAQHDAPHRRVQMRAVG